MTTLSLLCFGLEEGAVKEGGRGGRREAGGRGELAEQREKTLLPFGILELSEREAVRVCGAQWLIRQPGVRKSAPVRPSAIMTRALDQGDGHLDSSSSLGWNWGLGNLRQNSICRGFLVRSQGGPFNLEVVQRTTHAGRGRGCCQAPESWHEKRSSGSPEHSSDLVLSAFLYNPK